MEGTRSVEVFNNITENPEKLEVIEIMTPGNLGQCC